MENEKPQSGVLARAEPGALARAVCQVMGAVRYIPETGKNDFHGYRYASDEDLLVAVQPAMAEAGLALIPSHIDTRTVEHSPDRKNKPQWRTEITVTYDLLHVSGESRRVQGVGCGIDGEDKGVYKAMTGALKYALRHTFLLPTGDDPERVRGSDDGADAQREPERRQEQRRTPEGSAGRVDSSSGTQAGNGQHHPSWADDRQRFCARLRDMDGTKYEDVAAWLESHDRPRPSGMTQEKRDAVLRYLSTPDGADDFVGWLSRRDHDETAKEGT